MTPLLLDDVLPFVMDYLASYELQQQVSLVSKCWNRASSFSLISRLDRPWTEAEIINSSKEIHYLPQQSPKRHYWDQWFFRRVNRYLIELTGAEFTLLGNHRRQSFDPELGALLSVIDFKAYFPLSLRRNSNMEATFKANYLDQDEEEDNDDDDDDDDDDDEYHETHFSELTSFVHASLIRETLLLVISHDWTPSYSQSLERYAKQTTTTFTLEDRYEQFVEPWNQQIEEQDLMSPYEKMEFDDDAAKPGADVWAFLFHVPKDAVQAAVKHFKETQDSTKQAISSSSVLKSNSLLEEKGLTFKDVQRLCSNDYPDRFFESYYTGGVQRSENGRVVCMETGLMDDNHDDENPEAHCVPTLLTFVIDLETSQFHQQQIADSLTWPTPRELHETYYSYWTISPAGDCLYVRFQDGNDIYAIDAEAFYFRRKNIDIENRGTPSSSVWKQLWKVRHDGETMEGFFTVDGHFCLTQGRKHDTPKVAGPMAIRQVLSVQQRGNRN